MKLLLCPKKTFPNMNAILVFPNYTKANELVSRTKSLNKINHLSKLYFFSKKPALTLNALFVYKITFFLKLDILVIIPIDLLLEQNNSEKFIIFPSLNFLARIGLI